MNPVTSLEISLEFLGDPDLKSKKKGILTLIAKDLVKARRSKVNGWISDILRLDCTNAAWAFNGKVSL
jgi:HEAT repeat protein